VPEVAEKLAATGARVLLERGAGAGAQFPDALYKRVDWAPAPRSSSTRAPVAASFSATSGTTLTRVSPGTLSRSAPMVTGMD
jgi:NAD(P) transhydrogenase subunit alpha